MSQDICSACGHDILVHEPTHTACARCGVVQSTVVSYEQRRVFTKEEEKYLRHGSFEYIPGTKKGVGMPKTNLGRDARGKNLSTEQKKTYQRLSRRETHIDDSDTRNVKLAEQKIENIREHLSIPFSVAQVALKIYLKALREGAGKGRSPEARIAASLIIAAKKLKQNISEQDIMEYTNASRKDVRYCLRVIRMKLGIKYIPTDLRKLCFDTSQRLDLTIYTAQQAMKIIQDAKDAGLTMGKNPRSLVGAAIYMAAVKTGERRTQAQVAKAARTTAVTIRNRTKELASKLGLDIEPSRGVAAVPVYVRDSRELMNK
ncbi:MAG: transcription initiation factor IIB family protein [Promethearchaeota archaeon]